MRITMSLLLLSVLCLPTPALAGSAEDPDVLDPCGAPLTEPGAALPENDLCSAWLAPVVDAGGGVRLEVGVATYGAPVEGARLTEVRYDVGDCRHRVVLDDQAAPGRTELPEGITLLPNEGRGLTLHVRCDGPADPDCPYPPDGPVGCGGGTYDRVDLDEAAVTRDGGTLRMALDFRDPALAPFAPEPGSALTRTYAYVATTAVLGASANPGCAVLAQDDCVPGVTVDDASGRDVPVPLPA